MLGWMCSVNVALSRRGMMVSQTDKPEQGRGMEKGRSATILPAVGHLQLTRTLKIADDCCQLCQYKITKPNLTYPNPEE